VAPPGAAGQGEGRGQYQATSNGVTRLGVTQIYRMRRSTSQTTQQPPTVAGRHKHRVQ